MEIKKGKKKKVFFTELDRLYLYSYEMQVY